MKIKSVAEATVYTVRPLTDAEMKQLSGICAKVGKKAFKNYIILLKATLLAA